MNGVAMVDGGLDVLVKNGRQGKGKEYLEKRFPKVLHESSHGKRKDSSMLVQLNTEIENVDLLIETDIRLALTPLPDWGSVQYREQDPDSGGQSSVNDFS